MCGLFGITKHNNAINFCRLGLHALQHRGQEGAGISATDGKFHCSHRDRGLVNDIFDNKSLELLKGHSAIGHTRYSTAGGDEFCNVQPFSMISSLGWTAIAHNGNLVNRREIAENLSSTGSIFQSTSDTELIIHLAAKSGYKNLPDAIIEALKSVIGAYSLLILSHEFLMAVRDPYGFRPLVLGKKDSSFVLASETIAFDLIGADFIREIEPGEVLIISDKVESIFPFNNVQHKKCIFEHIYFSRPDSYVFSENVYKLRKELGKRLAKEQPTANADLVIPVPDSGLTAALGYAEESKLPFEMGLIRSHYVGRSFIHPKQQVRDLAVKLKINPVAEIIKNKNVVVVDDSLVRGTTSKKIVAMLKHSGAKKVNLRICAPPTVSPCFYGISTPSHKELLGAYHSVDEICKFVGADSLGYLSVESLMDVVDKNKSGYCNACFTNDYPTLVDLNIK